jgi:hypothetical protein
MTDAITFGWNAELGIPSAIAMVDHQCVARAQVLIATVDSTPRVSGLQSLARYFNAPGRNTQCSARG